MKYRKKPVVIESIKVPHHEYSDDPFIFEEVPEWLDAACRSGVITPRMKSEDYWYYEIKTLEGSMLASPGDFIIQGVKGELYPCKPDIFAATYEPA